MKSEKIRLGKNAFDENREIILPVDADSEKKYLKKQGEANGRLNSPDSQVSQPDAVEQGIIQKVAQTAQQTRAGLTQHLGGFDQRLSPIVATWDPTALINKIQVMPGGLEDSLNNMFRTFKAESAIRGPEWQDAQKEYEQFRRDNKLIRPPDYFSLTSIIFWFLFLIVGEAVLNATLLWELTGILTAFGQTVLITSVNVLFGAALVGLFFRYKNYVSPNIRWLTLICIPIILAVLTFNLGVGHYRDALVEAKAQFEQLQTSVNWDDASNADEPVLGFIDYTQKAMESMKTSPFKIDSVLSVLLIIVGIGFFGFATHKWYSMLDPYPGYRKCHLALKKTHRKYENLVETTRANMDRKIRDIENRVADERTKVMNMRTQHNELINRAQNLRTNYADWIVVLGKTQNALLALYQDSNQQARSEPIPAHFNNETPINDTLTKPPNFNAPNLGDMETVVEAVRLAEENIKESSTEIWPQFNQLANIQPGSDESRSHNS